MTTRQITPSTIELTLGNGCVVQIAEGAREEGLFLSLIPQGCDLEGDEPGVYLVSRTVTV